ncbi:Gfo/Idh/MocA family oxidoreductase [Primorskyibacter aestuariivivens]|uniref:Gfo/Idh/MocA family protein n=1 Tax=Primorskyibacter aestuariivivens TaxID=1888912 RepID=UPI0023017810|nr:Gfo/Idh/MocA family oxidoreductase [Primorskyibacter aestuariivivens]MDA7429911.1 Gfo/Idh/MocA family oxidoreductase [Primorskyibacter aestuariivivens]
MRAVGIIGCGFVADLYMRSLALYPNVKVACVFDRDAARLAAFARHWGVPTAESFDACLAALPEGAIVLNLTNPHAHYEVNKACLEAGRHVWCEKPLAMTMDEARALYALAQEHELMLISAPCSVLGEAAQTLLREIRRGTAGDIRLVYAELDDGFIPQAAYDKWISESGAPWPAEDEFRVGCTLEHAGYYLTWLIAAFGPVRRVVAASADVIPGKPGGAATPDFATATLLFHSGVVARLTCSIAAPHDHRIRVIGDKGVLQVKQAWDNGAPVRYHRRMTLRRRLMELPFGKRCRIGGDTHPKVGRFGAAAMNFALGPVEMLDALSEGRKPRLDNDFALHMTEVTLAMQNAGDDTGPQDMTTTCQRPEPMPWAR